MQARFQSHVDGGVSKAIHLPADVSTESIIELIQRARELGCKGIALWRTATDAAPACVRCGE
jgi:ribonucleoside-diphosphate reductase alpha chain